MFESVQCQSFPTSLCSVPKMPVDYTAYLLSSSPPGFEFYTLRDQCVTFAGAQTVAAGRNRNLPRLKPFRINSTFNGFDNFHPNPDSTVNRTSDSFDNSGGTGPEEPSSPSPCTSPRSPISPNAKIKKKVSFADDLGLALEVVKIMTEPSNTPPRLRSEIISCLTHGASASVATTTPPLVLNFSQPASNYVAFREAVDRNCVSLENVILKDYNMVGTIKVKNIAFEKTVFVRVTFDSWESYTDVSASYVPSNGCGAGSAFDTFSFDISVPTNMDIKKKIQFVICFEAANQQFWDNNNGRNYEVVSADYKEPMPSAYTKSESYGRSNDVAWSLYSNWQNQDSSIPYY